MLAIDILRGQLCGRLGFVHARRQESFWAALVGLVVGGRAELTAIGRSSARRTTPKHRIKAADRLLGNHHFHEELLPIWGLVSCALLNGCRRVVLLVDWTKIGAYHWALSASIAIAGRALPIFEMVAPEAELGTSWQHEAFLHRLASVLPVGVEVVLVTDAGFESPWFDAVEAMGWQFVGRIRRRVQLRGSDGRWISNKMLHPDATSAPEDLGLMEFPKTKPRWGRIVRIKDPPRARHRFGRRGGVGRTGPDRKFAKAAAEPWVIVSSLVDEDPATIVRLYRNRMLIEEQFRDTKNERWGWGLGRLVARRGSAQRIEVLLLLAALATLAMVLIGLAAQRRGLELSFQANTTKHRRVLSTFVLGTLVAAERSPPCSVRLAALSHLRTQIRQLLPHHYAR